MENKLELKHLAAYLPYGLKVMYHDQKIGVLNRLSDINDYDTIKISIDYKDLEHIWMFKPILRPMSDLNTGNLISIQRANIDISLDSALDWMIEDSEAYYPSGSYEIPKDVWINNYNYLFENHFDVFGLIEKGLAIDINTI